MKKTGENNQSGKRRFPWWLLALDFVGAALVAVGIYQFVSEGGGVLLIVAGLVMMIPLVLHILGLKGKGRG